VSLAIISCVYRYDQCSMPPRHNSPTVKRQRVSRSGRSRSEAVAAAASKRRSNASNAAKHKLLGLLILAHLARKAPANTRRRRRSPATRRRRAPKGLGF
jgi:hypothetical protein